MDDAQNVPAALSERDVVNVARDVITRLAPEELPLFGQAAGTHIPVPGSN